MQKKKKLSLHFQNRWRENCDTSENTFFPHPYQTQQLSVDQRGEFTWTNWTPLANLHGKINLRSYRLLKWLDFASEHTSLPNDLTVSSFGLSFLVTNTAKISNRVISSFPQLFRRVAAALPGMESMQETSKEGSILSMSSKRKQFNNSERIYKCNLLCNQFTVLHSTLLSIRYKKAKTDWLSIL